MALSTRDVSPPNILLSSSGEVRLTDFGIAKAALRAGSTQAGSVKGKYAYMAPEQARAKPIDHRADIFAAGCVLYEIATGRPVYQDAAIPVLLERVGKGLYEPPERVRPDLPPQLITIIKRALALSPNDRYPSARAMADDLRAYLYTLPPNPETELATLVDQIISDEVASDDTADTSNQSFTMASASLDDEAGWDEDSTQIESMSSMKQKIASAMAKDGASSCE